MDNNGIIAYFVGFCKVQEPLRFQKNYPYLMTNRLELAISLTAAALLICHIFRRKPLCSGCMGLLYSYQEIGLAAE